MNGFNANKWGVHMGTDAIAFAATQCEQAFTSEPFPKIQYLCSPYSFYFKPVKYFFPETQAEYKEKYISKY